jgi:hypothetical protein
VLQPGRVLPSDDLGEGLSGADAAKDFRLDTQRDQPIYIDLLVEAANLVQRIARVAHPYGVPVYTGSGFDGLKGKRAIATRARSRKVPTIVLHIGDGDKHGEDIYGAVSEDAVEWGRKKERIAGKIFPLDSSLDEVVDLAIEAAARFPGTPLLLFHRIGLTIKQATDMGLVDEEGKAEVDAVPVPVLNGWVREAIEALQDPARREELRAEEEQERKRLRDAIRDALDEEDEPDAEDDQDELDE